MRIRNHIRSRLALVIAWNLILRSQRINSFAPRPRLIRPSVATTRSWSTAGYRLRPRQFQSTILRFTAKNTTEPFIEWEAGDVYEDFDRLERAIAIYEAEEKLGQQERIQLLKDFAEERRALYSDLHKNVITPFALSLGLTAVCKRFSHVEWLSQWLILFMDVHFWVAVVAAPLALYAVKRYRQVPPMERPLELRDLGPEFSGFVPSETWRDPRTATDDYTLCLLEQVSSAVILTAVMSTYILPDLRPAICFITWLGALASWHQYPKLLNDLTRQNQPRPVTWDVFATQMTRKLQGSTRLLVLSFYRFMLPLDWSDIGRMYLGIGLAYVTTRVYPKFLSGETKLLPYTMILLFGFSLTSWLVARQRVLHLLVAFVRLIGIHSRMWKVFMRHRIYPLLAGAGAALAPLIHVAAFRKLVLVSKTSKMSLAMDPEAFRQASATATWRWRRTWREPERVAITLKRWWREFVYLLFFSGSVEDKLLRRNLLRRRISVSKNSVLNRVKQELKSSMQTTPLIPDRALWKSQAMDKIKEKHAKDYDRQKFDDPLGVAVYRTLGAGLGFKYDHMKPLREGRPMSMCRLHARAAKSAIRRANDLMNPETLRQKTSMDIEPREKQELCERIQRKATVEVQYLANRLAELVPPVFDFEDDEEQPMKIDRLIRHDFIKTANNELTLQSQANILQDFLHVKSDDVECQFNQTLAHTDDGEFIDAWSDRYGSGDAQSNANNSTCLA